MTPFDLASFLMGAVFGVAIFGAALITAVYIGQKAGQR
jgi:hypothetical protein